MNILCEVCGQQMEYRKQSIIPGSNEPGYYVKPCCINEDRVEDLNYIADEFSDIAESVTDDTDALLNFMEEKDFTLKDSKDMVKHIEISIKMLNELNKKVQEDFTLI